MAIIDDATQVWSAPVTLTEDEIWQTRDGTVFLTTGDTPGAEDGILLSEGQAVQLSAGLAVRYRKAAPTLARIVRESV